MLHKSNNDGMCSKHMASLHRLPIMWYKLLGASHSSGKPWHSPVPHATSDCLCSKFEACMGDGNVCSVLTRCMHAMTYYETIYSPWCQGDCHALRQHIRLQADVFDEAVYPHLQSCIHSSKLCLLMLLA